MPNGWDNGASQNVVARINAYWYVYKINGKKLLSEGILKQQKTEYTVKPDLGENHPILLNIFK